MRTIMKWTTAVGCLGLLSTALWAQQETTKQETTKPKNQPAAQPSSRTKLSAPDSTILPATGFPSYDNRIAPNANPQPSPGQVINPNFNNNYPQFGNAYTATEYVNGVQRPVYVNGDGPSNEFHKAVSALRSAKTDEERTEARATLNDLIATQLDKDLEDREKRIAEIEKRAKELREQLQNRRESKAELQKMLLLLVENQQSGLGLPQAWLNAINAPTSEYGPPTSIYSTPAANPTYYYQVPPLPNTFPGTR